MLTPSVACGKAPDNPTPQEEIAEVGPGQLAEAVVETLAPTPVDLPAEFSADFPIIPESTIVAASATPGTGGTLSEATFLEPAVLFPAGIEKRGQCLTIELRVTTRGGVAPDVGDLLD